MTLRIDLWVGKQRATGDMRHSIEKDKCVTIEVLRKLRLPHPTVRFMWRQAEYSAERLKAYLLDADYPAILKVGHIHQQKSTLFLPNKAAVQSKAAEYAEWTTEKMNSHFIDNNPVWMDSTNVLYVSTAAARRRRRRRRRMRQRHLNRRVPTHASVVASVLTICMAWDGGVLVVAIRSVPVHTRSLPAMPRWTPACLCRTSSIRATLLTASRPSRWS